jgi:uncharacterized protein (DUF885 family)
VPEERELRGSRHAASASPRPLEWRYYGRVFRQVLEQVSARRAREPGCEGVPDVAAAGAGAGLAATVPADVTATTTAQRGTRSPLAADAVAGVGDAALRAVVADHWEHMMRWSPTWATTLGDHRFDGQLARCDAESIAMMEAEQAVLIERLSAMDRAQLDAGDEITCELLRGTLEAELGLSRAKLHEWLVDSSGGHVLGELSRMVEWHVVKTQDDARNVVERMRQGSRVIDDTVANLERGLAAGRLSSVAKVARVLELLDRELVRPVSAWAMAQPAWRAQHPRQHAELCVVVDRDVRPALTRLRDFLGKRLLPEARGEVEGLCALPDGDAAYRASILFHVGVPFEPRAVHELGLAEIARTDRELSELGRRVLGSSDLASMLMTLREDRALYFDSRAEIVSSAQRALTRAKAAVPSYFSASPAADCVMREVPDYAAPYSTIAYYSRPHYDGSKPGEYFVNSYEPQTRPRFELEALTWHEAVPGHHLQIALSQELGELPAFRKLSGGAAFKEGWALYAESLAEEMGLYSSDLDRIGRVSFDAWRSARLVVDTGVHALGWTRAQAEAFMREHTALTPSNVVNEVDRYIGWPGQALAYKLGQLEILRLRRSAEQQLGARFDLKAFHHVVLGAGAVTLPVLSKRVDEYAR